MWSSQEGEVESVWTGCWWQEGKEIRMGRPRYGACCCVILDLLAVWSDHSIIGCELNSSSCVTCVRLNMAVWQLHVTLSRSMRLNCNRIITKLPRHSTIVSDAFDRSVSTCRSPRWTCRRVRYRTHGNSSPMTSRPSTGTTRSTHGGLQTVPP